MHIVRNAATLGVLLLGAGMARSTVLTFDISGIANFQSVNQAYGDSVTASTMGGFSYGNLGEGFTPDVTVSYGPVAADPALWTTGYGNLSNVLFKDADSFATMDVTLTAAAGQLVQLHSFDMAAFTSAFGSDPTINYVRVTVDGVQQFNQNNASISRTARTSFNFNTPLVGQSVVITFDSINLGGLSDDIAMDNIRFSQTPVPEPGSLLFLASGLLIRKMRRKRSRA